MKRFLRITLILIAVLIVAYMAGPKFTKPELSSQLPVLQIEAAELETYLMDKEADLNLKTDNQSRIVWNY